MINSITTAAAFAQTHLDGWVLAESLVKSTILLAATAGAARIATSAAVRHFLWTLGLLTACLLPLFSFTLPTWRVEWLPVWGAKTPSVSLAQGNGEAAATVTAPVRVDTSLAGLSVHDWTSSDGARPGLNTEAALPGHDRSWASVSGSIAFFVWAIGGMMILARWLFAIARLFGVTIAATKVFDPSSLKVLQQAGNDLGLTQRVSLLQSDRMRIPVTWGALRPVLLVPAQTWEWPEERRRLVILHELAHVKRLDWLTQTAATVACAVYWFNPLVWTAARQMRKEREIACDDLVLRAGARPSEYADELLRFASDAAAHPIFNRAAVPIARASSLEGRLIAILDEQRNRRHLSRLICLAGAVAAFVVVVPFSMLRAAEDPMGHPRFGPVIEKTIFDPDIQSADAAIDLDSGKLISITQWFSGSQPLVEQRAIGEAALREAQRQKVDLIGDASGHSVQPLDLRVIAVPNDQFTTLRGEALAGDKRLSNPDHVNPEMTPKALPATYVFETREGARGLLQILRFSNYQSADIRYKLLEESNGSKRTRRGASSATGATANPKGGGGQTAYVFDSREVEMRSDENAWFDLDTGKWVAAHPPGDLNWPVMESDLRVRHGKDMVALAIESAQWEISADEVFNAVREAPSQTSVRLGGGESRRTWLFKTREGGFGVLQIEPHSRRPGSVIVRYKLARPALQFAPPVTMILTATAKNRYLDLEKETFLAAPPTNSPILYLEERDGKRELIIENQYNYSTERLRGMRDWESMTAELIARPPGLAGVPFERKGYYPLRQADLPITVLLPGWGLLRVAEIDNRNPTNVTAIIQYKRVAFEQTRRTPSGNRDGDDLR